MAFLKDFLKDKRGNMIVNIVSSVGIAGFLLIVMITLNARAYTTTDPWSGIDSNSLLSGSSATLISTDINAAVEQSFEAQQQVAAYIPLFVLLILAGAFLLLTRGFTTGGGTGVSL